MVLQLETDCALRRKDMVFDFTWKLLVFWNTTDLVEWSKSTNKQKGLSKLLSVKSLDSTKRLLRQWFVEKTLNSKISRGENASRNLENEAPLQFSHQMAKRTNTVWSTHLTNWTPYNKTTRWIRPFECVLSKLPNFPLLPPHAVSPSPMSKMNRTSEAHRLTVPVPPWICPAFTSIGLGHFPIIALPFILRPPQLLVPPRSTAQSSSIFHLKLSPSKTWYSPWLFAPSQGRHRGVDNGVPWTRWLAWKHALFFSPSSFVFFLFFFFSTSRPNF